MFEALFGHPAAFTAAVGFLLVLGLHLLAWWAFGRDPVPPFGENPGDPPPDLSPASLRFAHRMAADTRAAAAALMTLAARRQVLMEWEDGRIRLRKTDLPDPDLPAAEAALAHGLLYTRSTLVLTNSVYDVVAPALARFREELAGAPGRAVFHAHRGWLAASLGLSLLVIGAAALQSGAPVAFLVLSALAVLAVTGIAALMQAVLPRRYLFPEPLVRGFRALVRRAVEAGFIVVGTPLAFVALAEWIADPPAPVALAFVAALAGLHLIVYHLMKAPTPSGADLRARIGRLRALLAENSAPDRSLSAPEGVHAFALDVAGPDTAWRSPPPWFRITGTGTPAPQSYGALGAALTRALDEAAMPPAGALFGSAARTAETAAQAAK